MKRFILIISLLFFAFISYSQTPFKIQNPYLNQSWRGDTVFTYIHNKDTSQIDSVVYSSNMPAWFIYDSIFIPEFMPGLTDTNILFIDGNTGRVKITTAAAIGGSASSKWDITGSTLHPLDTSLNVGIGIIDALGNRFRLYGGWKITDDMANFGRDSVFLEGTAYAPVSGLIIKGDSGSFYMNGLLDLSVVGRKTLFMGYVNDSSLYGYSNRRIGISIDTIQGINIYSSYIPKYQNDGIHISQPYLTDTSVIECDIEICYDSILIGTKIFSPDLRQQLLNLTRSKIQWLNRDGLTLSEKVLFQVDTFGYMQINEAYRFPNADGTANQVLTTNGSGTLSWQTPSVGGASYWDSTNTVIHLKDSTNNVAIGTKKLAGTEKLRVLNGAVLFDGTTGATPVSGAGTRFMWIPAKANICAGAVTGTQFDAANVGRWGITVGYNSKSSGDYSAVFGFTNSSQGSSAIIAGANHTNLTDYSATFGYQNYQAAIGSIISGLYLRADAYAVSLFGRYNIQTGTYNSWVATDPLFVVANGSGTGASANDLFRLNKNGSGWIGDYSSTQDPLISWGTDSVVKVRGHVLIDKAVHGFYAFEDSSVVVNCTVGTWVQVTNGTKNLFTAVQTNAGFTISGDTIIFQPKDTISGTSPHLKFYWGIDGHAGNTEDYEVRIFNVTRNYGVVRKAEGTTTGANNRIGIGTMSYDNGSRVGNRYVLQIKNVTNSNDFTIENGSIYIEASHF